jgi:hypothetical protein
MITTYQDLSFTSLFTDEVTSKISEASVFPIKIVYIFHIPGRVLCVPSSSLSLTLSASQHLRLLIICLLKKIDQEIYDMRDLHSTRTLLASPSYLCVLISTFVTKLQGKTGRKLRVFGNTRQVMNLDTFCTLTVLCPTKKSKQENTIRMAL